MLEGLLNARTLDVVTVSDFGILADENANGLAALKTLFELAFPALCEDLIPFRSAAFSG